jgi:hypothetical protein
MRTFLTVAVMGAFLGLSAEAGAQAPKKKAGPAPKVSAEMKDFMSYFNGDGKKTDEAIAKYKAKDGETSDMSGELSVVDAKVLKSEKKGAEDHYTMYAKTGDAKRTFLIVWKDKKIQKIKHLSMEL